MNLLIAVSCFWILECIHLAQPCRQLCHHICGTCACPTCPESGFGDHTSSCAQNHPAISVVFYTGCPHLWGESDCVPVYIGGNGGWKVRCLLVSVGVGFEPRDHHVVLSFHSRAPLPHPQPGCLLNLRSLSTPTHSSTPLGQVGGEEEGEGGLFSTWCSPVQGGTHGTPQMCHLLWPGATQAEHWVYPVPSGPTVHSRWAAGEVPVA